MAFAPPAVVAGPQRVPLPYGLDSVVSFPEAATERWQNGVTWESLPCAPADGMGDPSCDEETEPTPGKPKNLDRNGPLIGEASPFTIYGHFNCSPVGNSIERAEQGAEDHLLAREIARVEQAIWTGDLGNTPNFRDATVTMEGAAYPVAEGLGYLEWEIANNYGSLGVIHMTRGMALEGLAQNALVTSGGRLTTALGTPVVAGAGYDGSGPTGTAPTGAGESWAYATPAMFGYRGDIFTTHALDRGTNDLYALAERTYLVGWDDCGVGAVLLTLNSTAGA